MKRVGERGEGKFEVITWDEAADIVYENLNKIIEEDGPQAIFFRKCTEPSSSHGFTFISQLLGLALNKAGGLDRGQANSTDVMIGTSGGQATDHISNWNNAKTIIHWGSNIMESGMMFSRYFFDAKDAGAHMVAIDTRFSPTASKCHEWMCIRPGTDPALALAMVNHVLANKWYDEEFMLANTSFPFLVDQATGEVLGVMEDKLDAKTGEPVIDKATGQPAQVKRPYVWDTVTNSARVFNEEGIVPALEGTYRVQRYSRSHGVHGAPWSRTASTRPMGWRRSPASTPKT